MLTGSIGNTYFRSQQKYKSVPTQNVIARHHVLRVAESNDKTEHVGGHTNATAQQFKVMHANVILTWRGACNKCNCICQSDVGTHTLASAVRNAPHAIVSRMVERNVNIATVQKVRLGTRTGRTVKSLQTIDTTDSTVNSQCNLNYQY